MIDESRLRAAWRASDDAQAPAPCPPSAALWDAADGGLTAAERARIVDHVAACGACSEAWRIAAEVGGRPVGRLAPAGRRSGPVWVDWLAGGATLGLAAAATVLLAIRATPPSANPWRAGAPPDAVAAAESPDELPREAFALRWSAGAAGDRYLVRITREDLTPLYTSAIVADPTVSVPAAAFAGLPAGTLLYWQVEVVGADGTRTRSFTREVRLR